MRGFVNMSLSRLLPLMALPWVNEAATMTPSASNTTFVQACNDLYGTLNLANTTVQFTQHVSAGTNVTLPENDASCARPGQVVEAEMCRVALFVTTSAASNLSVEVWLPSEWTGRFMSTGNGGVSGCIQYEDMAYGLNQGFSVVSTNNGHNGTSALPMFHHPGVVEDFAYRAMHLGVLLGKQTSEAFYGKSHTKSYYLGCSTGGRQGFKEAQEFPEDFDGLIVGAPAFNFNNLMSRSASIWAITGAPGSPTFLTAEEWALVHEDAYRQCDHLDGVKDGVIEDTNLCQYRAESLLCTGNSTQSCLSPQQVETVNAVFSPLHGVNGAFVAPRMVPGANGSWGALFSGQPFAYSTEWFKYVVYEDANWDPSTVNAEDYKAAEDLDPYGISTWNGDLSGARDAGAKILHWHGLQDGLIASGVSEVYYNHVSRTMQLSNSELDSFYRFFRVSGCGHCSGGDGPSAIGNKLENLGGTEAKDNVVQAMIEWVEEGKAPDTITGYRWVDGQVGGVIDYERRHCRYPYRTTWDGEGDAKNPDSWSCEPF